MRRLKIQQPIIRYTVGHAVWRVVLMTATEKNKLAGSCRQSAVVDTTGRWMFWCVDVGCTSSTSWSATERQRRRRHSRLRRHSDLLSARHISFHPQLTLVRQINPQSNKMIGTLPVDGWAVTFGTSRRGLGGLLSRPTPPRCTKCNSPPINGHCQCTNLILFDVAL